MRTLIASLFLVCQLFAVMYAQFTSRRYFCWAPNDYVTEFNLKVTLHGRSLTPEQVLDRYALRGFVFENVPSHLTDIVQQYEQTYGRRDDAHVELSWTLNGRRPEQHWRWPSP